jgi:L-lactate dehydrogenase complex protein LldF
MGFIGIPRKKRHRIPSMRELASGIEEHTLSHLADYLGQFASAAEANGVVVHRAPQADEVSGHART